MIKWPTVWRSYHPAKLSIWANQSLVREDCKVLCSDGRTCQKITIWASLCQPGLYVSVAWPKVFWVKSTWSLLYYIQRALKTQWKSCSNVTSQKLKYLSRTPGVYQTPNSDGLMLWVCFSTAMRKQDDSIMKGFGFGSLTSQKRKTLVNQFNWLLWTRAAYFK